MTFDAACAPSSDGRLSSFSHHFSRLLHRYQLFQNQYRDNGRPDPFYCHTHFYIGQKEILKFDDVLCFGFGAEEVRQTG